MTSNCSFGSSRLISSMILLAVISRPNSNTGLVENQRLFPQASQIFERRSFRADGTLCRSSSSCHRASKMRDCCRVPFSIAFPTRKSPSVVSHKNSARQTWPPNPTQESSGFKNKPRPVSLTALNRQVSVLSFIHHKRLTIGGLKCVVRQPQRLFEHEVSDSGFEIPIDYRDRH